MLLEKFWSWGKAPEPWRQSAPGTRCGDGATFSISPSTLPVSTGPQEASALGNTCAQMIACGEIGGLDEARATIARSFSSAQYRPEEEIPEEVWRRFLQYSEINTEETVR
jgi:hypothetical protein